MRLWKMLSLMLLTGAKDRLTGNKEKNRNR